MFGGKPVITDYQDLPPGYKDRIGLWFSSKDLSAEKIKDIFDGTLDLHQGNHLLKVLHGRRVAGTLDDPVFAIHTKQYSENQIDAAMEYLRHNIPVDELMNAGMRAEDELGQMDQASEERDRNMEEDYKEKEGIKVRVKDGQVKENIDTEYKPDPVYGRSRFDEIRARNEAKAKAQEIMRAEERAKAEAEGRLLPKDDDPRARSLVQIEEGQKAITNPKIAKYWKRAQSDMKEPPKMSVWERVGPSALAFALTIGFLASLTMVYTEPTERYRLLPEVSAATATMGVLIGINVLVWCAWKVPPLWKLLNNYFIFVVGKPRATAMFTGQFSHQEFTHLATNMVLLGLAGYHLHEDLGRMGFLTLFLASGAGGFLTGLSVYTWKNLLTITTLGASGSVCGVLSAYYWDHRMDRFKIFGLPEDGVHGIIWWACLIGFHVWSAASTFNFKEHKTDVIGHWGGILTGMAMIEFMNWAGMGRRSREERMEMNEEKPGKVMLRDLGTKVDLPVKDEPKKDEAQR